MSRLIVWIPKSNFYGFFAGLGNEDIENVMLEWSKKSWL